MKIMIRTNEKEKWKKVPEHGYVKESDLQQILADSPDLIPTGELGGGRKSIKVAVREAGLPGSGFTDIIGIDESGNITVVETKLAKNPEIKREVIGQILEYAAYLWQKPYEEFDEIIQKKTKGSHLLDLMGKVEKENEEWSAEDFREAVETNLKEGRFALFIVVDEINEELRRTIDYLNSKNFADLELYALELKYFEEKGLAVVLPQLYGAVRRTTSIRVIEEWDEQKFLTDAKSKLNKDEFVAVEKLFLFSKKYAPDAMGLGKGVVGSINPIFKKFSDGRAIFCLKSNGRLGFSLNWVAKKGVSTQQKNLLEQLKERLKAIEINITDDYDTYSSTWLSVEETVKKADNIIKILTDLINGK